MEVARRRDGAVAPFVGRQPDALIPDHEGRVEREQTDHPPDRGRRGDDEQPVVPAGAQPADRPHPVTADAVGHQPLALGSRCEVARHFPPEPDLPHEPQCWCTVAPLGDTVTRSSIRRRNRKYYRWAMSS